MLTFTAFRGRSLDTAAYIGMASETEFKLKRIGPLTRDFNEIIGTSAEEVETVSIANETIVLADVLTSLPDHPAQRNGEPLSWN